MSRTYRKAWSQGPVTRMTPDGRQQRTPQWWSRHRRLRLAAFTTETFEPELKENTNAH